MNLDNIKLEWTLASEHINSIRKIYWVLFFSIIVLNGFVFKLYLDASFSSTTIDIIAITLLLINIIIVLIYQREHYSLSENYFVLKYLRNKLHSANEILDLFGSIFYDSPLKGFSYAYYLLLKICIIIPIPTYLIFMNKQNGYSFSVLIYLFVMLAGTIIFIRNLIKFDKHLKNLDLKYIKKS